MDFMKRGGEIARASKQRREENRKMNLTLLDRLHLLPLASALRLLDGRQQIGPLSAWAFLQQRVLEPVVRDDVNRAERNGLPHF